MGKEKTKVARYVLTEDQISNIAAIAAQKGIESYKEEQKRSEKERSSRVKNNAKLLVTNYRRFKAMCSNATYDQGTVSDDELSEILELMQGYHRSRDFELSSIKDRVVRTKMIMDHVDSMLEIFKRQCESAIDPEESRRYRVIEGLYLLPEPKSIRDIAEEEAITTSTAYRDCDKAYKRLAILFFGIDGLRV